MSVRANLSDLAKRIVRRVEFHACQTLVFIRPDGVLDSCPAFTERASALLAEGAAAAGGFSLVGNYAPGVNWQQIVADAREVTV